MYIYDQKERRTINNCFGIGERNGLRVCDLCIKPIRKEDGIFMVAHARDCLLATKMTFYVEFVLVPTGGRR